LEWGAKI